MEYNVETLLRVKRILRHASNKSSHKNNNKAKLMLDILESRIKRGKATSVVEES